MSTLTIQGQEIYFTSPIDVVVVASSDQTVFEWDVDGLPVYVGKASQGISTGTASWTIKKYTWSSGLPATVKQGSGSWDNRAALTYS